MGSAFVHPPYAGMITYSANTWGTEMHPADLSAVGTDVDAFHEMLQSVLANIHRALAPGGVYGVLLGSWRKNGVYHHLPAVMTRYAPRHLVGEVIKVQHNVTSGSKAYEGDLVRIAHETLLIYRRAADPNIFAATIATLDTMRVAYGSTWRNFVGFARERGGEFGLEDLYAAFDAHPRARTNPNYRAKLPQIVRDEPTLERFSPGRYAFVGDVKGQAS